MAAPLRIVDAVVERFEGFETIDDKPAYPVLSHMYAAVIPMEKPITKAENSANTISFGGNKNWHFAFPPCQAFEGDTIVANRKVAKRVLCRVADVIAIDAKMAIRTIFCGTISFQFYMHICISIFVKLRVTS